MIIIAVDVINFTRNCKAKYERPNFMTKNGHLRILIAQFKKLMQEGQVVTTHSHSLEYLRSTSANPPNQSGDLNEAQIRQSFVLPLVSLLGWNTEDPFEVFPEERTSGGFIDIRTRTETGQSLIWEIKRPSTSLDLNTSTGREAAFQGVGYARTFNNFPYCIVTNFEETKVFHAYSLPSRDRISENLVASFTWKDIESGSVDTLLRLFAKDSVQSGHCRTTLDLQIAGRINIRNVAPLHEAILLDLEKWRLAFVRSILECSDSTEVDEADRATQILLNRLLFIRCTEDRGIESRSYSRQILEEAEIWKHLVERVFHYFRDAYNSDLFVKDPLVDDVSLRIDNEILKQVIRGLHGTNEIYDFSIIPLEILGNAYENYLAKKISRKNGDVVLELKPEVKKSGGICYTPPHIVDAIISETLGKLSLGFSSKSFLPKVLDPACGSGTFLIRAFDFLIARNRGTVSKKSKTPPPLDIDTKRKILQECIFGSDLDEKAVEITKLSLFLKLLEGMREPLLFKHAVLPTIEENVRRGNSLITPEMVESNSADVDLVRTAPLNWSELMRSHNCESGFDAIIGNPPYVRIQVLREFYPKETDIYVSNFESASQGNVDLFIPFIEKFSGLLKPGGFLGYICPSRFWTNDYGATLRRMLADSQYVSKVINFRAEQVFAGVTTYTSILVLNAKANDSFEYFEPAPNCSAEKFINLVESASDQVFKSTLPTSVLNENPWLLAPTIVRDYVNKIESMPRKLSNYVDRTTGIFQGLITGSDPVFLLESREGRIFSKALNDFVEIEDDLIVPVLKGSADLSRLEFPEDRLVLLFLYETISGAVQLISDRTLKKKYPRAFRYLQLNEIVLRKRAALKTANERAADLKQDPEKFRIDEDKYEWHYTEDDFYKFSRNQALNCVRQKKLIVPSMFRDPTFFMDVNGEYALTGSGSGGGGAYAMIPIGLTEEQLNALTGILSSMTLRPWFERRGDLFQGYYVGVDQNVLFNVPLPDLKCPKNRAAISNISRQVTHLLRLSPNVRQELSTRNQCLASLETEVRGLYSL